MNLSNQKKVIGLDLDGVILDHASQKVKLAKEFGYEIRLEQTPSDIFFQTVPDKEIRRKIQHLLYDDPVVSLQSSIMEGAVHGLDLIKSKSYDLFLISRRKNPIFTIETLKYHKLWPKYFSEDNTFFVSEPEDKEIYAKKLNVTHYVDDEQKVLDVLESVKNKFLFDPYQVFKDSKYARVKDWIELKKALSA